MKAWAQGKLLDTADTRAWSDAEKRIAEAEEARRLFENFSAEDQGRSRRLIATFHGEHAARNCALAEQYSRAATNSQRMRDLLLMVRNDYEFRRSILESTINDVRKFLEDEI